MTLDSSLTSISPALDERIGKRLLAAEACRRRPEQHDPPGLVRHPAADQHGHAGHRERPSSELPASKTCCAVATSLASALPMPCQNSSQIDR